MDRWSEEVAGAAVGVLVLSLVGGVALMFVIGGLVFGALAGGVAGAGALGFRAYKKRKEIGLWEEPGDASNLGLFEPGGVFLGEEIKWD